MLAPVVLHHEPKVRLAHHGCVFSATWLDAPTLEQMQLFSRHSRATASAEGGTFLFNIVIDGTPKFDPRVRAEAGRLTAEGVHSRGAAHVILVEGFRGAATRAFLSSLLVISRPKVPAKVVGDVASAVRHAETCLPRDRPEADPRTLQRFIEWSIARPDWPPPW